MTDIDTERDVSGRMRPNEHAIRCSFVFHNVVLEPLNHTGNVAASAVPLLRRMPLHRHADHAVLHGPSPDIVVKRVGFPNLLLDLIAGASGDVNQNSPVPPAFFGTENIEEVLRIRT